MAYTMDTTLGDLMSDPRITPLLEQQFPGISTNPMVMMAKGMSLNAICNIPQAQQLGFTCDKAQALLAQANQLAK